MRRERPRPVTPGASRDSVGALPPHGTISSRRRFWPRPETQENSEPQEEERWPTSRDRPSWSTVRSSWNSPSASCSTIIRGSLNARLTTSRTTPSRSSSGETLNTENGELKTEAPRRPRQPATARPFGKQHDPADSQLEELRRLPAGGGNGDGPLYKDAFPRGKSVLRVDVSLGAARLAGIQVFLHRFPLHHTLHRILSSPLGPLHLCPQDSATREARALAGLPRPAQE